MTRILLIGGGAVGSLLAANLQLSDSDEEFELNWVVRSVDYRNRLTSGVRVSTLKGEKLGSLQLDRENLLAQLPDPRDLEKDTVPVVAVKVFDVNGVRDELARGAEDGLYIFNGMLCEMPDRVGILNAGANMRGAGVRISEEGELDITDERDQDDGDEEPNLSVLLSGDYLDVFQTNSVRPRYVKLAVNAVINPLAGLSGARNGEVLEEPLEPIATELIAEIARVYSQAVPEFGLTATRIRDEIDYIVEQTSGNYCSTVQDLREGRRTETPWINGWLAEKGEELDADVDLNRRLTELVIEFYEERGEGNFYQPGELVEELPV